MDLITNGPWKKTVMNFFRLGGDDDEKEGEVEALLEKDKVEITWERILWKKLIECFDPSVDTLSNPYEFAFTLSSIQKSLAAIVFWSNRLAFITDMDLITNGPWKKTVMNFFRLGGDDDEKEGEVEALLEKDKVEITWERILWKKLIECFDPSVDNQGVGLFFYVPLRIFIAMFLIPFWLLVGIISAGWLWPPQVREGLFVQAVSIPEDSGEIREVEKRIEEVSGLRKDLEYVQGGMINEFKQDRKDMTELKNQVKGIKKDFKREMKNIKQVMTSLFEVQQQAMVS